MPQPLPVSGELHEWMVRLRRDFHRRPELSWQETHTAEAVCRELASMGIAHRGGVGGTGVVADVRAHLREAVPRIAAAVGQLHGAKVEVELVPGTPALINQPGITALAREAAVAVARRVTPLHTANMGGEDFAFYVERVEGCYVRFGARIPGREGFPAHSSRFDFDEEALAFGAAWFTEVAVRAGERVAAGL